MRLRIIVLISVVLFLIAAGFGLWKRGSYRDFTLNENPLEYVEVGVLSDQLAEVVASDDFVETIKDSANYILKVRVDSEIIFEFLQSVQYVIVEEVYKGTDIKSGDRIMVSTGGTNMFYVNDTIAMNMGFVHPMNMGEEYLIYLENTIFLKDTKETAYLFPGTIVRPAFSYQDMISKPVAADGKTGAATNYKNVKNYEFFAETEKGIETLKALKEALMIDSR